MSPFFGGKLMSISWRGVYCLGKLMSEGANVPNDPVILSPFPHNMGTVRVSFGWMGDGPNVDLAPFSICLFCLTPLLLLQYNKKYPGSEKVRNCSIAPAVQVTPKIYFKTTCCGGIAGSVEQLHSYHIKSWPLPPSWKTDRELIWLW